MALNALDYWKISPDFTVVQAALIVCGVAPERLQWSIQNMNDSDCPTGYVAIKTAFVHALESGRINASKFRRVFDEDIGQEMDMIDIQTTTISVEEIDRFLKSAGMVCDFFDRSNTGFDNDPNGQGKMPPKLNAALKAWKAVTSDPVRMRGKSPKQALEHWLVENADDLGLRKSDGTINRTGIEEICKVANWKPSGGATPTPTVAPPVVQRVVAQPLIRLPPDREDFSANLDDEIPF